MLRPLLPVLVLTAAGLAACSPTTDGAPGAERVARQCFFSSSVNSFRESEGDDRDSVIVRVGTRDEYELAPTGVCRDIRWAQGLVLTPALGSGNSLCVDDLAYVNIAGGAAMPDRCQVRVVRKIEPVDPAA